MRQYKPKQRTPFGLGLGASTKVMCTCDHCGAKFMRQRSAPQYRGDYCSHACHVAARPRNTNGTLA